MFGQTFVNSRFSYLYGCDDFNVLTVRVFFFNNSATEICKSYVILKDGNFEVTKPDPLCGNDELARTRRILRSMETHYLTAL